MEQSNVVSDWSVLSQRVRSNVTVQGSEMFTLPVVPCERRLLISDIRWSRSCGARHICHHNTKAAMH